MTERVVIGGHAVDRCDGAEGTGVVICAPVAHDADRPHRQDCDKGLPDLVIKPVLADLVDVDGIGLAQDIKLGTGDFAGAADGKTGAGKWVAPDETVGQAQVHGQGRGLRP